MTVALPKKVVLIAPFWDRDDHVGVLRVRRFQRWLIEADVEVILVAAGKFRVDKHPWGYELRIPDPLIRYGEPSGDGKPTEQHRIGRHRTLAVLLNPDAGVVWARWAARHEQVLRYAAGAEFVISSSPPESTHVAAIDMARRLSAGAIVDLRDGWLDEPLKPLLIKSRIQRWREGRLEAKLLACAEHIFVTSEIWHDLLRRRFPDHVRKCTVLTNAMPADPEGSKNHVDRNSSSAGLTLRYTGRFRGSHASRSVDDLMQPLIEIGRSGHGRIEFVGDFSEAEMGRILGYAESFEAHRWGISVVAQQPHSSVVELQKHADGLLLLSASRAAIPAKMFEYLATGRPILAVSQPGSSVWHIGEHVDSVFNCPLGKVSATATNEFLAACMSQRRYQPPEQYCDAFCRNIFLETLSRCFSLRHDKC